MRTLFALTALVAALSAAPVLAADPAPENAAVRRTLEAAGLMGVWGVDCDAMASSLQWEQIVMGDDGWVQSVEGGDDSIASYRITAVERLNATDLRMTFAPVDPAVDGEGLEVVYRVEPDRQMTWSSKTQAGEVLVADGRFTDGEMGQWYQRCPKGIPTP